MAGVSVLLRGLPRTTPPSPLTHARLQLPCTLNTHLTRTGTTLANITNQKNKWEDVPPPPIVPRPDALPNSFSVVYVGGSQYKVVAGDYIMTQKLTGCDIGNEIVLKKVLLVGTREWTAIGVPLLENARVYATVEEQTLTQKVLVFKYKRRKNYRRLRGVRTPYTLLRITDIVFDYQEYLKNARKAVDPTLVLPQLPINPNKPLPPEEGAKKLQEFLAQQQANKENATATTAATATTTGQNKNNKKSKTKTASS